MQPETSQSNDPKINQPNQNKPKDDQYAQSLLATLNAQMQIEDANKPSQPNFPKKKLAVAIFLVILIILVGMLTSSLINSGKIDNRIDNSTNQLFDNK